MGNKTIKWKYGEKLLVQAVMDYELHEMLIDNIFVAGYEFSETVSDRDGNQVQPFSPELCSLTSNPKFVQKPTLSLRSAAQQPVLPVNGDAPPSLLLPSSLKVLLCVASPDPAQTVRCLLSLTGLA